MGLLRRLTPRPVPRFSIGARDACPDCGYCVAGSRHSELCPECGVAVAHEMVSYQPVRPRHPRTRRARASKAFVGVLVVDVLVIVALALQFGLLWPPTVGWMLIVLVHVATYARIGRHPVESGLALSKHGVQWFGTWKKRGRASMLPWSAIRHAIHADGEIRIVGGDGNTNSRIRGVVRPREREAVTLMINLGVVLTQAGQMHRFFERCTAAMEHESVAWSRVEVQ